MKKVDEGKQLILFMLLNADKYDTHPICTVHEECGTFNKNVIKNLTSVLYVSEVEGGVTV
jgi:hypothetical protein